MPELATLMLSRGLSLVLTSSELRDAIMSVLSPFSCDRADSICCGPGDNRNDRHSKWSTGKLSLSFHRLSQFISVPSH